MAPRVRWLLVQPESLMEVPGVLSFLCFRSNSLPVLTWEAVSDDSSPIRGPCHSCGRSSSSSFYPHFLFPVLRSLCIPRFILASGIMCSHIPSWLPPWIRECILNPRPLLSDLPSSPGLCLPFPVCSSAVGVRSHSSSLGDKLPEIRNFICSPRSRHIRGPRLLVPGY